VRKSEGLGNVSVWGRGPGGAVHNRLVEYLLGASERFGVGAQPTHKVREMQDGGGTEN